MAPDLLKIAELQTAAVSVTTKQLDHFPLLISDEALQGSFKQLANQAAAALDSGSLPWTETLTMPRSGSGPRPVIVLSSTTRTIYTALINSLAPTLVEPSRQEGAWDQHTNFGLSGSHKYVVDLDIAACYEYIDHSILREELLLRSLEVPKVTALVKLLQETTSQSRGLPQMLAPSDHLADTYLSIMDRRLLRDGHELHRYADDTRVLASEWDVANRILEDAAEYARSIGLILASNKSRPHKRETLASWHVAEEEFFNAAYTAARDSLTHVRLVMTGPYGDDLEEEVVEPGLLTAIQEASRTVIRRWAQDVSEAGSEDDIDSNLRRYQSRALASLTKADDRVDDETLLDLAFYDPQRMQHVVRYLTLRAENPKFSGEAHWDSFLAFTKTGRDSPWSKLWLFHLFTSLPADDTSATSPAIDWVKQQLTDRHEVVRCQAAWSMAARSKLPTDAISELYRRATPLTQPGLAAAAARQTDTPAGVRTAVVGDSPLNKEAAQWAETP